MHKKIKTIGLLLGSTATLYGWQTWRTRQERQTVPPPGELIDINGRQQHIWRQGSGSPLVLIDGGLGSYSADWQLVFPLLPPNISVMIIDRPGLGWSPPTTAPRTSRYMAKELKAVLDALDLDKTPLILVGHSLGAFTARMFAHLYPEQVKGAILIDGAHEDFPERLPSLYAKLLNLVDPIFRPLASLGARLGGNRAGVAFFQNRPLPEYPTDFWSRFTPEGHRQFTIPRKWPSYIETTFAELAGFKESCQQIRIATQTNPRPFKHHPLITLCANVEISAERFRKLSPQPFSRENFISEWERMQAAINHLSHQGELRVIPDSGHNITLEKPAVVAQAIIDIVERTVKK